MKESNIETQLAEIEEKSKNLSETVDLSAIIRDLSRNAKDLIQSKDIKCSEYFKENQSLFGNSNLNKLNNIRRSTRSNGSKFSQSFKVKFKEFEIFKFKKKSIYRKKEMSNFLLKIPMVQQIVVIFGVYLENKFITIHNINLMNSED